MSTGGFAHGLRRLDHRLAHWTSRRMAQLRAPGGVVSISFDDAPRSSCTVGRDVLESHGVRGSWYVSGGLTDQLEIGLVCHSEADLIRLVLHGHHVGCHTFTHRPCTGLSRSELEHEWDRNAEFLSRMGVPENNRHFSFPLGRVGVRAKRLAAQRFASSRGTDEGVQVGRVDLNGLRANKLYQSVATPSQLQRWIGQAAASHGWLILYTHDVQPKPSAMGCTAERLAMAVDMALRAGCQVLPVDDVIRRHTHR